jgi:hypothetical protein
LLALGIGGQQTFETSFASSQIRGLLLSKAQLAVQTLDNRLGRHSRRPTTRPLGLLHGVRVSGGHDGSHSVGLCALLRRLTATTLHLMRRVHFSKVELGSLIVDSSVFNTSRDLVVDNRLLILADDIDTEFENILLTQFMRL